MEDNKLTQSVEKNDIKRIQRDLDNILRLVKEMRIREEQIHNKTISIEDKVKKLEGGKK